MTTPNVSINITCNSNCFKWCPRVCRIKCCCCSDEESSSESSIEEKVEKVALVALDKLGTIEEGPPINSMKEIKEEKN